MAYKIDYNKIDPYKLNVFSESRKRRTFVGSLQWDSSKNIYEFNYDPKYARSEKAIPLGKELDLFKKTHTTKGKLFPSFSDRIPSKENPAYEDYCKAQGISKDEKNPIILLVSIGRKGPSSFVFEPVVKYDFTADEFKKFRKDLDVSIQDIATAFDFNLITLHRFETGKKVERNVVLRLQIYLTFPKVAMWQLSRTGGQLQGEKFNKLWAYFESLSKKKANNSISKS